MKEIVRTKDELEKTLTDLVEAAVKKFGCRPCVDLIPAEEGDRACLVAIGPEENIQELENGVEIYDQEELSVDIYPGELGNMLDLVNGYKQPNEDFEPTPWL